MLADPFTYVYKSIGHCDIKADVYRPSSASSPAPVIVFIHGGCLIYGSRQGIIPWHQERYLDAGYTVVSIDYRLAPETRLPLIIEDLQDAFRWVRDQGPKRFGIDPDRLAVVGHSAGGYLTLMAGFCVEPRPRALVSFYGYGDIVADWYSKPDPFYCRQPAVSEEESGRRVQGPVISEPYEGRGKDRFYLYCRQHGTWPREVSGHDPETEPEFFVPYSPERNVTPGYPPTLLLHGDQDTDVPYQQSATMAAELARHQVEHRLITGAGGGHGFGCDADDPQAVEAFAVVMDFLEKHTA